VRAFYNFISNGKKLSEEKPVFATFEEAHYIIKLVEAIVESSRRREWVEVV
jgi:predicted dehydrogenase